MKDFVIIEGCNFKDCPMGGQLTYARQLIKVYGERIALVGLSTDKTVPIGKWIKLKIDNKEMEYFAYGRLSCKGKMPLIPARISSFFAIIKYRKLIFDKSKNAIVQAPELLIAISNWGWNSLCYRFPGVENPLLMPRFKWGRPFADIYEKQLFKALKKVDVILASAGSAAIKKLVKRSRGSLKLNSINQFPTRVDTNFFKPINVDKKRDLNIQHSGLILVTCGRINTVKGWNLILESFKILRKRKENIQLYFVGEGEDRGKLENKISSYNLSTDVHITGYQTPDQVLKWLNVADLILVGSHKEGWSISMLESLACGKPIVSTDVSGAKEMINEGKNGYIVYSRNPKEYAENIIEALKLKKVEDVSLSIALKYSLSNLKNDLDKLWTRKIY